MFRFIALVVFAVVGPVAHSYPTTYSPDDSFGIDSYYDNRPAPPFSIPGQFIEGIQSADIIRSFAQVWDAENLLEGEQLICRRFGPAVSQYTAGFGQEEIIEQYCSYIEESNVEGLCRFMWSYGQNGDGIEGSISLIPGIACREQYDHYDFGNVSTPDYAGAAEMALDMAQTFNPYDICSGGISKINNIVFALMDWLGPSVYSNIYKGELEPYATCGIIRYILSLDPTELVQQVIGILQYPVADILEHFRVFDICQISQGDSDDVVIVRLFKNLLVEYSDLNERTFCEFISYFQTRYAYLELGKTIVTNVLSTFSDRQRCNNILTLIAPLDTDGIHYKITGYNLTLPSQRNEFCRRSADAFSPSSTYVPTAYQLPPGVNPEYLKPFDIPGEFLPGLTFIDLIKVDGVAFNSEKIIDGLSVYCTVFENLFSETIPLFDFEGLCTLVRDRDTAGLENICLSFMVPPTYGVNYPLGLRTFDPISVLVYAAKELTAINDVNINEICPAVDDIFNGLSLQDLTENTLDIFLTELFPVVDGMCRNWDAAVCHWKPYCPMIDYPTEAPRVTDYSWQHYRPIQYRPSPEDIERFQAEFEHALSSTVTIVLAITGYESRESLCGAVSESIDPLSGRADPTFASSLRSTILGVLTDVERCSTVIETTLRELLTDFNPQTFLTKGNTNIIYQFTGFESSEAICQALAREVVEFPTTILPQSPAMNGKLVATYNIFAKIAVYAERVARSI